MRDSYLTVTRLANGESVPVSPNADFVKDFSGNVQVVTPSGAQVVATAQSVQAAVMAAMKKVTLA